MYQTTVGTVIQLLSSNHFVSPLQAASYAEAPPIITAANAGIDI